jgi:hypothetical protein
MFVPAACLLACAVVYVATGINVLPTDANCSTGGCGGRWFVLIVLAAAGSLFGGLLKAIHYDHG